MWIGLIVASYMIVYTHNFTRFDTWRKFACFSGIAPFDHESGTSVKGKTKVSPIANKQLKTMLHLSAICAIHTDTELKEYYHRRLAEGKPKISVINIIRNKLAPVLLPLSNEARRLLTLKNIWTFNSLP